MTAGERPKRIDGLISEELEGLDEVIYVQPETGSSFSLNPTAAAVLDLCDGSRTIDEIAAFIADTLDADVEAVKRDVEAIIAEFADNGLLAD